MHGFDNEILSSSSSFYIDNIFLNYTRFSFPFLSPAFFVHTALCSVTFHMSWIVCIILENLHLFLFSFLLRLLFSPSTTLRLLCPRWIRVLLPRWIMYSHVMFAFTFVDSFFIFSLTLSSSSSSHHQTIWNYHCCWCDSFASLSSLLTHIHKCFALLTLSLSPTSLPHCLSIHIKITLFPLLLSTRPSQSLCYVWDIFNHTRWLIYRAVYIHKACLPG